MPKFTIELEIPTIQRLTIEAPNSAAAEDFYHVYRGSEELMGIGSSEAIDMELVNISEAGEDATPDLRVTRLGEIIEEEEE